MEIDMSPMPYRTRSTTKRARSPSSPTQYDRPSKRAASGQNISVAIPFPLRPPSLAGSRGNSEDWVTQTQGLRLESPLLGSSGYSTPVSHGESEPRVDEVMVDEPMRTEDAAMSISPQRAPLPFPELAQSQFLRPEDSLYQTSCPQRNPNQLQIPSIQIQTATPSPVQMFPQPMDTLPSMPNSYFATSTERTASLFGPQAEGTIASPQAASRKQRFTMGPRADCELCRARVKGHYMHFD